jgi:hypothetical protein
MRSLGGPVKKNQHVKKKEKNSIKLGSHAGR